MHLTKIELKDWKAYISASIELPRPDADRNVILIGAQNGFGKTSLFEAIVLGVFGKDGLPLIARAPFGSDAENRLEFSYNNFLGSSLNSSALADGRQQCSIGLRFEDDEGEPLIMRRIWYFSADGKHKPADEELRVYRGRSERMEGCPPNESESEWRSAFVARELLPHPLAKFFLFDGEQVQVLAQRDMSAQIKTGIEGLLGINILRDLVTDLKKYGDNRRSQVGNSRSSPKEFEKIRNDIIVLESELESATRSLEITRAEWERLSIKRDLITSELSGMGAGTSDTTVKDRFEELNRIKRTLEELFDKLQRRLSEDLSLALAGGKLRTKCVERLAAEAVREDWEAGRRQSEAGLERFVASVTDGLQTVSPPLVDTQAAGVTDVIRSRWDELWHPAPDGCAPNYRNGYLRGADREAATRLLRRIGEVSVNDIGLLVEDIAAKDKSQQRLENEIAVLEGISPQLEAKANELRDLNKEIDKLAAERGRFERETETLTQQLNDKRRDLARYAEAINRAGPSLRRANWADKVSEAIEAIVRDAVPGQIDAVAEAMTRAFRSMSHKGIVERVEIDSDCSVKLLSATGRDVRELALSAGEQQVFAQALIAAIAEVSQRDFPIIVDTPLGRLDDAHREGVLRYFTDRPSQVIMLSTDTEVVGRYKELVEPRLAATFHVEHEISAGVGRSRIVPGYFPGNGG